MCACIHSLFCKHIPTRRRVPNASQKHKKNTQIHTGLHTLTLVRTQVKCLIRQLLQAVAFLHANAVLHRDIKLSNLLYTSEGLLKLCDFGLAR